MAAPPPPAYANGKPLLSLRNPQVPPRLLGPTGQPMGQDDGEMLVPHAFNFAAIWNYFNKTYSYRWDEALRHSWENTQSMRRDAFINACLDERYCSVTQQPWHVECYDEQDEQQQETADQITNLVRAIPKFSNFLRNLEEAAWYGRYGVQWTIAQTDINGILQKTIGWHRPENGDKIQVGWDGIPRIMISSTVRTDYEKKGYQVLMGERGPLLVLDKQELRERFAINQHWRDDADYYAGEEAGAVGGSGIRTKCYWYWWIRTECTGWALNFYRKVGTLGLLVFPFVEGNPDSEAAAEVNIRNAGNRSSLAVPVPIGTDPKQVAPFILSPQNAGIESLMSFISGYYERHIERFIVGQNMSDGKDNDSGLGGTGRSEFAAISQYQKIRGDCDLLAECLTTDVLKPIHRWNFPGQPFRYKFVFGLADPKSKDKLEAAKSIVEMGVTLRADDVRDLGGFNKPNPEDEIVGGMGAMPGQEEAPFGLGLDKTALKAPPFGKGLDGEMLKTPVPEPEQKPDEKPAESYAAQIEEIVNKQQHAEIMARMDALQQVVYQRSETVPMAGPTINFQLPPDGVHFHVPESAVNIQPQVHVDVAAPTVNVAQPDITVESPTVHVAAPTVNVAAPDVTVQNKVDVPKPDPVNVEVNVPAQDDFDTVVVRDPQTRLVDKYERRKKKK